MGFMNERIVKLFMESVDSNYIPVPIEDHIPSWTEKFAELIVKECADIAKHHVMNISTYADADFVDEQIKQHFGVEK